MACRILVRFLVFIFLQVCFVTSEGGEKEDVVVEETAAKDETEEAATESTSNNDDSTSSKDPGASDETATGVNVLTLTTSNFDDFIKKHDTILVEFFAPWCGHCKSLAPEYEKAAKVLKTNDPPVALAAVDATVESDLASRFDVSGYPTLKFFKKGAVHDYDGPRYEEGIVEYMTERADANWKPPPEAVITLTQDNFDEIVNKEPLMLVEFYAPWCGHCKKLAPEYEKAAKIMKNYKPPIPLGKVDATAETALGSKYQVSGYPTLKIFKNGKATEYKGGQDEFEITDYMRKQIGSSSKLLKTKKAVMDFVKDWEDIVIMGFFENENDDLLSAYLEANNDLRDDFRFGHTSDSEARKAFGFTKNTIALIHPEKYRSKYEEKYAVFKGDSPKVEDIEQFYQNNFVPLVGQMTQANEERRYKRRPLIIVYYGINFSFEHREGTQYWRNKVLEVANEHRDFTFAIADEEEYERRMNDFGLDDSGEDVNVVLLNEKERRYRMEDEFSEDSLRDFVEAYKNGELKPQIKSQPVPKVHTGPVQVVVGLTFDDIVYDNTKDILIELYAPWCGHCKAFEPTYKKLAQKYKDEANLVIAKLDATANDVPVEYKAEGFPTIFFAPAGNKTKPVKYEGGRELDDFVKFLQENSTVLSKDKGKEEL